MTLRYLSLFSGIEAATVAWHPLGWECVGVAEIAPFPCRVLAHHYPDVPNLGSVSDITAEQVAALGHIDLVVGGFPCQDLSVAGKQRGLLNDDGSTTRSGLFLDAMRVVRWAAPRWLVVENAPGMLSSNGGDDFRRVVSEMAGREHGTPARGWAKCGASAGPDGLVEWRTLDAQWFGVAQRRRRVFLVRDSGDWLSRPPVLLEPESLHRDPPSREEARQDDTRTAARRARERGVEDVSGTLTTAYGTVGVGTGHTVVPDVCGTLTARASGSGGLGTDLEIGGGLVPKAAGTLTRDYGDKSMQSDCPPGHLIPDAAPTMTALSGGAGMAAAFQKPVMIIPEVAATLLASVKSSPTNALDHGQTLVVHGTQDPDTLDDLAHPLAQKNGGIVNAVCFATNQRDEVRVSEIPGALPATPGSTKQMTGVLMPDVEPTVFIERGRDGGRSVESRADGTTNTILTAGGGRGGQGVGAFAHGMTVRRLTPVECARLQGFPDDYLNVPDERGKPAADTPKYSALGNSMAVPCMSWIGRRIERALGIDTQQTTGEAD